MAEQYRLKSPQYYQSRFDGSRELFMACWRQYRAWIKGAIGDPMDDHDVMNWLDQIATDKVTDSRSRFYIFG